MIFRKAKYRKEVRTLNVYDDIIYISNGFNYKFIEVNGNSNQCENCFFNKHKGIGCEDAPCGFHHGRNAKRKDRKIGYFKLISDLNGDIVNFIERQAKSLLKENEALKNDKELLCRSDISFNANRKIYLSGPMSILIEAGKEDEVIEMFRVAEMNLKNFGFEVVNPFNNGVDKNEPWIRHILADLALLDPCDCICYLHTWDLMQSSGSEMEKIVARKDKKIEIKEILRDGNYSYILL